MPILFKDNTNLSQLKQALYNLFKRDKKAINNIINLFIKQGQVKKVLLRKPSITASPTFIIWKNNKL